MSGYETQSLNQWADFLATASGQTTQEIRRFLHPLLIVHRRHLEEKLTAAYMEQHGIPPSKKTSAEIAQEYMESLKTKGEHHPSKKAMFSSRLDAAERARTNAEQLINEDCPCMSLVSVAVYCIENPPPFSLGKFDPSKFVTRKGGEKKPKPIRAPKKPSAEQIEVYNRLIPAALAFHRGKSDHTKMDSVVMEIVEGTSVKPDTAKNWLRSIAPQTKMFGACDDTRKAYETWESHRKQLH